MFRIIISDAKTWKNLMTAVSTLVEEATFNVTPDGISLRAMDPSHVAMVDFEYPKDSFQEYSCKEPSKLCIDIADMLKLMKRVEAGENLELSLDQQTGHLAMKLTGKYTRKFSVPLLQPTTSDIPTPKLVFDAKIKMDASCFNDAVDDISTVSEQVKFEATPEKLIMSAGSETGNVVVEFDKTNPALIEFQVQGSAKSLYGINFLRDMIKAGAASSGIATVEFSSDKPVRLDFDLTPKGKLIYYLAPRLE
jgi:proliferating cell nuclear antigen